MQVAKASGQRGRGLAVVLVGAYVGAVLFSVLATRTGGQATLWLATGFLASALILAPRSHRIAICAACAGAQALVQLAVGDSPAKALLYPSVNLLEAVVAAWLAVTFCSVRARRVSLIKLALLVMVAVVPAAMLGGAVGSLVDLALRGGSLIDAWLDWTIPTLLGMAIIMPTVLLMTHIGRYPEFVRPPHEVLALLGALCGVTAVVYLHDELPMQFMIFPTLTLVALRLGPPGAAVATLLVSMISLPLVTWGGGSPKLDAFADARLTELVIATALFSALATAVSVAEQARLKSLMLRRDRAARTARARARAAERAVRSQTGGGHMPAHSAAEVA